MENAVRDKSFQFAIRTVKLYKHLVKSKKEYVLSKQLLKSGTSIGANIEEALGGQSKRDFISKVSIAYKESRETDYWLRLIHAVDLITQDEFNSISKDCTEIQKILSSILITTKNEA